VASAPTQDNLQTLGVHRLDLVYLRMGKMAGPSPMLRGPDRIARGEA
jgi:hypothetical protein